MVAIGVGEPEPRRGGGRPDRLPPLRRAGDPRGDCVSARPIRRRRRAAGRGLRAKLSVYVGRGRQGRRAAGHEWLVARLRDAGVGAARPCCSASTGSSRAPGAAPASSRRNDDVPALVSRVGTARDRSRAALGDLGPGLRRRGRDAGSGSTSASATGEPRAAARPIGCRRCSAADPLLERAGPRGRPAGPRRGRPPAPRRRAPPGRRRCAGSGASTAATRRTATRC